MRHPVEWLETICNNSIKRAKRHYFTLNIDAARNDPKKSWKLINDLSFRKIRNECNVKKVNIDGNEVNSAPDISDAFNTYILPRLAQTLLAKLIAQILTLLLIFIPQMCFLLTKLTWRMLHTYSKLY